MALESHTEIVAAASPSLVGVVRTQGAEPGTGFVALPSGLMVSALSVVGYAATVTLRLADGRTLSGRVVRADVAQDIAYIMPAETLNLPTLRAAPSAPEIGEVVFMLGMDIGGPRLVSAMVVGHHDLAVGQWIELDRTPPSAVRGAPLLNDAGRVLGVVCDIDRAAEGWLIQDDERRPGALAVRGLEPAVRALSGADLTRLRASYACPWCGADFTSKDERCRSCGGALPHSAPLERVVQATESHDARGAKLSVGGYAPAPSLRAIRELLASMGLVESEVRVGEGKWVVRHDDIGIEPVDVQLALDATGHHVEMRVPVMSLVAHDVEPLMRLLLTLNDETTGLYYFLLDHQEVVLAVSDPVGSFMDRDVAALFSELSRVATHYRARLIGAFPSAS